MKDVKRNLSKSIIEIVKPSLRRRVTGLAAISFVCLLIMSRYISEMELKVDLKTGVQVLKWAGLAEKKKNSDSTWSAVREGEALSQGDRIRTLSGGQMSLLLEGRGRLEMTQDSVAQVEMTALGLRVRVTQGMVDLYPEVPRAIVPLVRREIEKSKTTRTPASVVPVRPVSSAASALYGNGNVCEQRDLLQDLSTRPRVADAEIEKSVLLVKKQILGWFEKIPTFFDRSAFLAIESRIAEARVTWGSTAQESEDGNADLEFSSSGVLVEDPVLGEFIRLGDRFASLLHENPARAHLELTRLVMLTVSPCVLSREGYHRAWDRLLVCLLGKPTSEVCSKGSEADAAWAVSTAVAIELSGATCLLPAQERDRAARCLGSAFEVKR